jgi:hypothetical protein
MRWKRRVSPACHCGSKVNSCGIGCNVAVFVGVGAGVIVAVGVIVGVIVAVWVGAGVFVGGTLVGAAADCGAAQPAVSAAIKIRHNQTLEFISASFLAQKTNIPAHADPPGVSSTHICVCPATFLPKKNCHHQITSC